MNKILFVASHLYSGSFRLLQILNENPRIEIRDTGWQYNHPQDLDNLLAVGHKLDSSAAIYGDHLLYNTSLLSKAFYHFSKFIYVIREAKPTLNGIVSDANLPYNQETAFRYYCFRLRRMYEMARRTPGAIFLREEDIPKSLLLIQEEHELKHPLVDIPAEVSGEDVIDATLAVQAQDVYEKYLFYFKQLNLKFVSN